MIDRFETQREGINQMFFIALYPKQKILAGEPPHSL